MPLSARRLVALPISALLVAGLLASAATPVLAASHVVTTSADTIAADGKCSLREALANSESNTQAVTGAGECPAGGPTETITFDASRTIVLSSPLPSLSAAGSMTIDGGGDTVIDGNDANRILTILDGFVSVNDIVLRDGRATSGGAVYIGVAASVILNDVTVTSSTATNGPGGGIFNDGGILNVFGAVVTDNTASTLGGGIASTEDLQLLDAVVTGNSPSGVDASGGTISIGRTRIESNTSPKGCAGIRFGPGADASVNETTIAGNTAADTGGGLCLESGGVITLANVRRSTISGNAASGIGGGVLQAGGTLRLIKTTLYGNSSGTGGTAIAASDFEGSRATLKILNTTVTGNTTPNPSPAKYAITLLNTDAETGNAIIGGNTGGDLDPVATGSTLLSSNDITGSVAGILDPLGLRANGGLTKTVRLLPTGTAAIDAGNAFVCQSSFVGNVDQRGLARPQGSCDIGAVELDKADPNAPGAPETTIRTGVRLDGARMRVRLTWDDAIDDGLGIGSYRVERSVNGAAFTTVATVTGTSLNTVVSHDKTYRFRVTGIDFDGNEGPPATAGQFKARLVQQTSGAITYRKTWSTSSRSSFSGGSARWSKTFGASATLTTSGRAFALVTTTGPTRGKARIYVDGVLDATVDLRSDTTRYRVQAWTKTFPTTGAHTIRVAVLATSGRPRVDVDAFIVLR